MIGNNFDLDKVLERWRINAGMTYGCTKPVKRIPISKEEITDELLEQNYIFSAQIVEHYGEIYLPIFERLHHEIEQRKKDKHILDTALKISRFSSNKL